MASEKGSPSLNCLAGEASERGEVGERPVPPLAAGCFVHSSYCFVCLVVGSLELRHVSPAASQE